MKKLSLVVLCLVLGSAVMVGQLRKGAMGVTGGTGSSSTMGFAYGLSDNLRLGVDVEFSSASTTTTFAAGDAKTSTTILGIGVSAKMYMSNAENLSTYFGGGIGFGSRSDESTPPASPTTKVSSSGLNIGVMYGAEYWFSPRFSWYGHVGLGYDGSSSDGPPKESMTNIGTSYGTGLTWWM